jgi:hypothetical protein
VGAGTDRREGVVVDKGSEQQAGRRLLERERRDGGTANLTLVIRDGPLALMWSPADSKG